MKKILTLFLILISATGYSQVHRYVKVQYDSSKVVTPYALSTALALKLNISDTASMLSNYAKSSAVALKLNISDTAAMLSPYTRVTVSSYAKNATRDSTILLLSNGTRFAAKDSLGSGGVPYTGATQDVNLGEFGLLTGNIEFDNTPTNIPTSVGSMNYNDTDGTVDLRLKGGNVSLQIGQESVVRVVNKTATSINLLEANYQAVRVTGAQGQRLKVDLAQATTDLLSAETIGLVTETINNNQEGFITTSGLVRSINTTGSLQSETWADGDIVYLSPTTAGRITNVKPSAPNHLVIIGYVIHAHATQGSIFVKVDNGYELDELHNVKITTPTNNQALLYNSTTDIWENKNVVTDTTSLSNRINLKQNLVTLTTTGTSGAATFNQSTGALNIPSYTGGGSGSIDYTTQGYGIKVDSSGRVYTVRVDSTVIGSKTYVNKVVSDSMTQLTIGAGLELTNDTLLSLKLVTPDEIGGVNIEQVTIWDNAEPDLGVPSVNGYVLSSTTAGDRSWVDYISPTGSQTLTNKRITPRVNTIASSGTPTPTSDISDMFTITALAANATFEAPTGTPTDGQSLLLRIKDNGTARTLGWNAIYRAGTDFALPTTTVISKTIYLQLIYNAVDTKWDAVGLSKGY